MGVSQRLQDFCTFLYDPKKKTVCFKSITSWFLILSIYLLLFALLVGFWALALWLVFPQSDAPKLYGKNSILGDTPGLGIAPFTKSGARPSNLYHFFVPSNSSKESNSTGTVVDFFSISKGYLDTLRAEKIGKLCNDTELYNLREKNSEPCRQDISIFLPCLNGLDARQGPLSPCFFITVNNIYSFEPVPYNPLDNVTHVLAPNIQRRILDSNVPRQLYIDCDGDGPVDREVLKGRLRYFPDSQAIPLGMFPFWGSKRLEHPMVGVQLVDLIPGQMVRVSCRFIFKGADYNNIPGRLRGMTTFNVLID